MSNARDLADLGKSAEAIDVDASAPADSLNIDSSGNVLVGKTASGTTTAGFEARANGQTVATIDGGTALIANRETSDGDIISVMKDGGIVGSIGVEDNHLLINSETTSKAIIFSGYSGANETRLAASSTAGVEAFRPFNSYSSQKFDLGSSSRLFKDLYLSGGVYLGGTGSANYLDDYEEGTWTPGASVGTVSSSNGQYVKIGNTVHIWGFLTGWSNTTNNEPQYVTGKPFANANSTAIGSAMWEYVDSDSRYGTVYLTSGDIRFYDASRNSGFDNIRCIDMDGSQTAVYFHATYQTT